jgi:hypothetical protein
MIQSNNKEFKMPFDQKKQDRLEAALADRDLKEQLLDDLDAIIKAFNTVLAKLDSDDGVTDTDYSINTLPSERVGGKKFRQ